MCSSDLNCLCSVGTYADDGDRCPCGFFNVGDVVLEFLGELTFTCHLGEIGLPSWQSLIYSLPALSIIRHLISCDAVLGVLGADFNLGEGVEHIAFHHDKLGDAVYHNGIAEGNEVEPPATTVATSYSAIFVTYLANLVACLIEKFNREGTTTDTGRLGLEDTEDFTNSVGSHTKTRAYTTTYSIGGRNEGIGSMVDVEHCTLSAFSKDFLAFL